MSDLCKMSFEFDTHSKDALTEFFKKLQQQHEVLTSLSIESIMDVRYSTQPQQAPENQPQSAVLVTVMGELTLNKLADVAHALADFQLQSITPLKKQFDGQPLQAVALALDVVDIDDALRALTHRLTHELQIDVIAHYSKSPRSQCQLLVMDMDSTLIQIEVIDELAKIAGVGDQVVAITESAMRGELDFSQSLRKRVSLLQGLSESAIDEVADRLPLMQGAERLMTTLQHYGCKTAILSGGFTYFAQRLQQRLGIDYIFSNYLEISEGALTGQVQGEIVDATRKAELLQQLAQDNQLELNQTMAVGDGANDLLMIAKAGLGVAFHAKPLVQQKAPAAINYMGLDGLLYLMNYLPD